MHQDVKDDGDWWRGELVESAQNWPQTLKTEPGVVDGDAPVVRSRGGQPAAPYGGDSLSVSEGPNGESAGHSVQQLTVARS